MNILNLFRREKIENAIDHQLKVYIDHQHAQYGVIRSVNFQGWLKRFIDISKVTDMTLVTVNDVLWYKEWVNSRHSSEYLRREAMKPINSFLRFNRRCDIIFQMNKLGRKPDYMAIAKVKDMRSKKKTYEEIIAAFKKEGRKIVKSQVSRWTNKVLS